MGKTVVFWTKSKEYGDTAAIMAAVACNLGITEGKSVAVTSLPGRPSEFFDLFSIRIPEKIKSGKDSTTGFYPLLQKALFEKPTEKMIGDAAIRTINKGPLLFPWFDWDDSISTEKNAVTLIMGSLKDSYDYVLVDGGAGEKDDYADLLIRNADLVLVLLPQDKRRWKDYFEDRPLQSNGRFIYIIYPYQRDSDYPCGWFTHHFLHGRDQVLGVELSAAFTDACAEGRVAELFLEAGKKKKAEQRFFKEIAGLAKGVNGK